MTLLPAPARVPGPEQGALRPAWPVRGIKGPRIWAHPAPELRFQAGQPGMDCLPFLQRCRTSQNFAGQLDGIENFSSGEGGFSKRTSGAAAVPLARSAREEMLTRPESCAALLTSKLQRRAWRVAHGAGLLPSSRERKKRVCRSTPSSRPHPLYSLGAV